MEAGYKPQLITRMQRSHRITEWSGLAGTSVGHLVQPPAQAGSPTVGCRGPCPGRSGISPEKETPQPPHTQINPCPSGLRFQRGSSQRSSGLVPNQSAMAKGGKERNRSFRTGAGKNRITELAQGCRRRCQRQKATIKKENMEGCPAEEKRL